MAGAWDRRGRLCLRNRVFAVGVGGCGVGSWREVRSGRGGLWRRFVGGSRRGRGGRGTW